MGNGYRSTIHQSPLSTRVSQSTKPEWYCVSHTLNQIEPETQWKLVSPSAHARSDHAGSEWSRHSCVPNSIPQKTAQHDEIPMVANLIEHGTGLCYPGYIRRPGATASASDDHPRPPVDHWGLSATGADAQCHPGADNRLDLSQQSWPPRSLDYRRPPRCPGVCFHFWSCSGYWNSIIYVCLLSGVFRIS